MALPEDVGEAVYATAGYEQSVHNLSQVSLDSDNVFGDGYDLQLPEKKKSPAARPRVIGSTSAAPSDRLHLVKRGAPFRRPRARAEYSRLRGPRAQAPGRGAPR